MNSRRFIRSPRPRTGHRATERTEQFTPPHVSNRRGRNGWTIALWAGVRIYLVV